MILVNMMDNNSDRFLVIVDVVAVAALTIGNCCTLFYEPVDVFSLGTTTLGTCLYYYPSR
jgi:hypothetical protein